MKEITFQEYLERRQAEDLRLIDVREADEFAEVHVKEAELLPLTKICEGQIPEDDGRPIIVICRSGGRSAQACAIFEKAGLPECTNLLGGTIAAEEAGEEYVQR